MIAGTLWSLRCKEWLLCCSTGHGRLVCASVHRHAVQIFFDLSQSLVTSRKAQRHALQAA